MNRVIHDPSELDALPVGSVVMAADGRPLHKSTWGDDIPVWFEGAQRWAMTSVSFLEVVGPLTVLHDPSALSMSTENAIAALSEWGVDESDVAAIREAVVEAAAWKLIDRTSDLADRGPSDETVQAALADARAALPFLTAAPSATRDEVARLIDPSGWRYFDTGMFPPDHRASIGLVHNSRETADALLARFTITPKEDR